MKHADLSERKSIVLKNIQIQFSIFFIIIKMSNNNTYYARNKEWLQEKATNCYHQEDSKEKARRYNENNKGSLKIKAWR